MSSYTSEKFINKIKHIDAYPTLGSKLRRRLADVPWTLAAWRDNFFPGEFAKLYQVVAPYTMCSNARLRGLYQAVRRVVADDVPGDVVECGTARGGSAALLGLTLKQLKSSRTLWVFDTFEGLPPPTEGDPDYEIAKDYVGTCRGELEDVENLLRQCGIIQQARLVKGLFKDTLPVSEVQAISVLHLDGDWYESVKVCLEQLYDRVSPGGVIQIDDYGHWAGARRAVEEFQRQRGLTWRLRYLDYTGRQFIKPV